MQRLFWIVCTLFFALQALGQGTVRGDFMMNANFYQNDPRLGQFGTNTTQYQRELSSSEAWFFLNYNYKGFDFNFRYDMFHNSPLLNPQEAFTQQGLAFFNASKQLGKLNITVGAFYDQFGSGVLFRAYEDRVIGLDFAMRGVKLEYQLTDNLRIKGFSGRQKYRFGMQPQVIQGANIEGNFFKNNISMLYGGSAIKRTLSESQDMASIVSTINSYPLEDRFVPKYNVYGVQLYGTLNYKKWTFMTDMAYKTPEAIFDFRQNLIFEPGLYGLWTLGYSTRKFSINLQHKRSEYFFMRTSPYTQLKPILEGTIGFLAPINRQNTYRLPARYSPAVQELGEIGYTADINYSINRKNVFNLNLTHIEQPDQQQEVLFRELFFTYSKKFSKKVKATFGYQSVFYNQKIYEGKPPSTPNVITHTPFVEVLYKIKRRTSVRFEGHFLRTDQDLGDFAFGLIEFNVAPKYSISVSDMVNTSPREETRNVNVEPGELVHYPTIFFAYTHHQTRFTAGYIKQVEGVVCTGGVCRVEPAFSGFKFGLSTNF